MINALPQRFSSVSKHNAESAHAVAAKLLQCVNEHACGIVYCVGRPLQIVYFAGCSVLDRRMVSEQLLQQIRKADILLVCLLVGVVCQLQCLASGGTA